MVCERTTIALGKFGADSRPALPHLRALLTSRFCGQENEENARRLRPRIEDAIARIVAPAAKQEGEGPDSEVGPRTELPRRDRIESDV